MQCSALAAHIYKISLPFQKKKTFIQAFSILLDLLWQQVWPLVACKAALKTKSSSALCSLLPGACKVPNCKTIP